MPIKVEKGVSICHKEEEKVGVLLFFRVWVCQQRKVHSGAGKEKANHVAQGDPIPLW